LSDDDRTVLKVNPTNYEVVSKWIVPIINPEGIAFNAEGKLIIVSDDRKMIYYFDNPEN
jgi:sugar lactone lactonase YvrE